MESGGTSPDHRALKAITPSSYAKLSPKEREARAVAAGVKIYGEKYRTELASSFSHHRYKPLNEPTGRVCFAGDWRSYTDAWQHGAFTPARKAVTALHARVLSS
ncbi:FAD-dependent oxidoreductase [Streptomyces sp. NPDC002814]